jgi:hypothetical protein
VGNASAGLASITSGDLAITDQDGPFEITDIPPGTHRVTIWHPYVRDSYEQTVTVRGKESVEVDMTVTAPTGRLYANQMVENGYIRHTIREDTQSQIVPTLEKQSY